MLQLLHNGAFVQFVFAGKNFTYEGRTVSGAGLGWKSPDGTWELVAYVPPEPEPQPDPVPEIISRRQFYMGLEATGRITKAEALAALRTGTIPDALQVIIDGMTDEDAAYQVETMLIAAGDFFRDNPFVLIFAITQGMNETEVDDFWRLCAAL